MEDARTKIAEYKHDCSTIDDQLSSYFQRYGQVVYEVESSEDEQLVIDARTRVSECEAAVKSVKKSIQNIEQAKSASETAKEEISKIEQRLASIEYEKNSLYSRIGVITYEEYAAGEVGEEFSLLFTSITHQNADLSRLKKELKENELRYVASSFFEKISLKRKRKKLKDEMEKIDTAREDLFRNAGKQICNSELIKKVKSKNAAVISGDFNRLDQERDRMYALLESRKIDFNRNQDILNKFGVEIDIAKKVREMDKRLHKAEQALDQEYTALGKSAFGSEVYANLPQSHSEIAEILVEIDRLQSKRKQVGHQLSQLEINLKIREIESIIDVDHQKEIRAKSQLESFSEQLKEIDQRILSNRKQIASLKQILLDDSQEDSGTSSEQS